MSCVKGQIELDVGRHHILALHWITLGLHPGQQQKVLAPPGQRVTMIEALLDLPDHIQEQCVWCVEALDVQQWRALWTAAQDFEKRLSNTVS